MKPKEVEEKTGKVRSANIKQKSELSKKNLPRREIIWKCGK
jgi:hypothetical protein